MGTSSNQRSRAIPSWAPARALLGRNEVPAEAQSSELWKSALADGEARIQERLTSDALCYASLLAQQLKSPTEAVRAFEERIHEREPSLLDSVAKRALVRSVVKGSGSSGFASELFAEGVAYLASRDLPSYVGAEGRVSTVAAASDVKSQLQDIARQAARAVELNGHTAEAWHSYVVRVLASLSSSKT